MSSSYSNILALALFSSSKQSIYSLIAFFSKGFSTAANMSFKNAIPKAVKILLLVKLSLKPVVKLDLAPVGVYCEPVVVSFHEKQLVPFPFCMLQSSQKR